MVRITRTQNQQQPAKLDKKAVAALHLLGIAISNEPSQVRGLLQNYGVRVSADPTANELADKALYLIGQDNKPFHYGLSEILSRQVIPGNYDGFNIQDIAGASDGADVTVGADPVSAIAGAIGSVASLFGNAQQKKMLKEQARSQTMSSILAYKAQQEKAASDVKKQANQKAIMMTAGTVVLVAFLGWIFMRQPGKPGAPQVTN